MNTTTEPPLRRTLPRSANSSASPDRLRAAKGQRPGSSDSDTSAGSNATSLSVAKRSPYNAQLPPLTSLDRGSHSNTSLPNYPRPSAQYMPHSDGVSTSRRSSPLAPAAEFQKHRPRQHSQGFFEPSLPSASLSDHSHMAGLTASQ